MAKRAIKRVGKTRRYLVIGDVVHHLYETEDGHHRTRCGVITRDGEVVRSVRTPDSGKLCDACRNSFVSIGYICGDGGETPSRPMKTIGGKKKIAAW